MKRILTVFLALLMVVSLAACGGKTNSASPSDLFVPDPPTLPSEDNPAAAGAANATELMDAVWAKYGEDERFPIIGGDFDHAAEDGPDVYSVEDPAMLDSDFGLPAAVADKVDEAASIRHMMNVNTFTGVAFHVTSAGDVQTVADALKDSVMAREWLCGFPDKLVIILVNDYVISLFGNEELVDAFQAKALETFDAATVAYDEPLV